MTTKRYLAVFAAAMLVLAVSGPAPAGEKGHGSMSGTHGGSTTQGQGMMKMGDKVFEGKIGAWKAEARLVDMKAQMEKSKVSEKMTAKMKHTHHLAFSLDDAGANHVTEGKGTVTVTGTDKKQAKYELMAMEGHFGSVITLDKTGMSAFSLLIKSREEK